MKKWLLALPLLAWLGCTPEVNNPVLTIEGGQVQGVLADNPGVYVYRGIPYAAPPIGDLRWKEPQPVVAWDGVKIADTFGHPGYQAVHYPGGPRLRVMPARGFLSLFGFMVAVIAKVGDRNPNLTVRNGPARM